MARVTVEDCVQRVPNRFELVLLAAQRSRDVSAGAPLTIDRDNDKNPVVALREIADKTVSTDGLSNAVVQSLQKHVEIDEPEEDDFDLLSTEISADLGEMLADGAIEDEVNEDVLTVHDESGEDDEGEALELSGDGSLSGDEKLSGDEEI